MFVFVDDESDLTFEAKVSVQHPKFGKQVFTAEFAVVEQDELEELARDDKTLLERVFVGFGKDVRDADKNELEFSQQIKAAMIKRPYVRTAMATTYMSKIQGFKRGN